MRENTLKQRLYAGKAAFGVMCNFPSPPVVEMLGHLGFDWILLDNEHGSITVDTAEACIAAAELSGMAPIVRPVANKPEIIAPFLDRGAWGVQVPHVNTADEARAAVDAVKYGGGSSRNFQRRSSGWLRLQGRHCGLCPGSQPPDPRVPDGRRNGGHRELAGSGYRGRGGRVLHRVGDLSQSMGLTGQQAHPDVQQAMERGVKIITGAGRIAGCSCPDNLIPKFLGPACSTSTAA